MSNRVSVLVKTVKYFKFPIVQCQAIEYNVACKKEYVLQGGVQVPTGGKVREPKGRSGDHIGIPEPTV